MKGKKSTIEIANLQTIWKELESKINSGTRIIPYSDGRLWEKISSRVEI